MSATRKRSSGRQRRAVGSQKIRPDATARAGAKATQRARMAAEIASQTVKEASPAVLRARMQTMIARGDLVADLGPEADELSAEEQELLDQEPEMDLGDPDEPSSEAEETDPLLADPEDLAREPGSDPGFEIVITQESARFEPPWWIYGWRPANKEGQTFLAALDRKLSAYARLAEWLQSSRAEFLVSRDLWDFGPAGLSELQRGEVVVTRQGLRRALSLNVDESTFSRYCQHVTLVWRDGAAPLQALFNRDACLAWAARGIAQLVPAPISAEDLDYYRGMPAPKSRAGRRHAADWNRLASATAMEVVHRLCLEANVSVGEVIDRYGDRIRGAAGGAG